jgi:predicted transcriptional regulator
MSQATQWLRERPMCGTLNWVNRLRRMTTETVTITVRLDQETVAFLDRLAEVQDRDRSYLIEQAVANFVRLHRWQIEEIERGVKEADAGLFATAEEVEGMFSKWTA